MKNIALAFCLLLIFSCVKKETTNSEVDSEIPEVVETNEPVIEKIELQVKGIEEDASLSIESAQKNIGDISITTTRYLSGDQLLKVYWRASSAYGDEFFKIYYGADNVPICILSRSIQHLCDENMNTCFSSRENYYDQAELLLSLHQDLTHKTGQRINYDTITIKVVTDRNSEIIETDERGVKMVEDEIRSYEFQSVNRYEGEYMYFADAAVYKDCTSGKIYPINSYDLEKAYLKSAESQTYVDVNLIGRIEIQPNMEGNPVETMIPFEILTFNEGSDCPTNQ